MNTVYFGTLAHLLDDPFLDARALEIIEKGALWVGSDGRIVAVGPRRDIVTQLPRGIREVDYGEAWLLPGLIDAHLHFPQYYVVAAPNQGLLAWLKESVFPAEMAFRDVEYAAQVAEALVCRLLAAGVTTAMIYGSQFLEATIALFEAARRHGLRLLAGITLMDRGGPEPLLLNPETGWRFNEELFHRYREQKDLYVVLTPRFALSCSPAMLDMCGEFRRSHPEVHVQTHINETPTEIEAVAEAFPEAMDYLDVYQRYGLLGPKTVLAHNIHPQGAELRSLAESGCGICHCPSSNLFLGSGLFPLRRHVQHGIPVALGTDIGAGLHFSVWNEMAEAYKIQRLQRYSLSAGQLLYLATLGAARALHLEQEIGNFGVGKCADFWVLSAAGDAYLEPRLSHCQTLEERLFVLIQLASSGHRLAVYRGGGLVGGSPE